MMKYEWSIERFKPIRSPEITKFKVQPKTSLESLTILATAPSNVLHANIVRNIHRRAARCHEWSISINVMHLTRSDPSQNVKDERVARLAPPLSGHPQDHEIHDELKLFQPPSNDNQVTNKV